MVKNVTGYDLCKVLAGSFGTLAAMTEVTIKTLPRAETEETMLVVGLDDASAMRAMARRWDRPATCPARRICRSHVAARFDGLSGSADRHGAAARRRRALGRRTAGTCWPDCSSPSARSQACRRKISRALWRSDAGREALRRNGSAGERPVWRISTAPSKGAEFQRRDLAGRADVLRLGRRPDLARAAEDRRCGRGARCGPRVGKIGGHATLVRAPAAIRAAVDVFEPQEAGLAALSKRLKENFDPKGVLNPGRMWAGV